MKKCYNCGIELTKENTTREHIPAQNIFTGYPENYKNNRLVVPACFECNNKYSKIDQEIRDAIGIMNDNNVQQNELTQKSVKSILRKSDWVDRLHFTDGKVKAVSFSYGDLKDLHVKNFKGVFFQKYGYPLPDNFEIEIMADGDEENQKLMGRTAHLYQYVTRGGTWKVSGHEDIFKYDIKAMAIAKNGDIEDNDDLKKAICVIGILVYHQTLMCVVVAAKKKFLKKLKNDYL